MGKPGWATALAAVVRPAAIILGATFAIHRLAGRLQPDADGSGSGPRGDLAAFPERLVEAFSPDRSIVDAAGRTALLAGVAVLVGLAVAWAVGAVRGRFGPGRRDRADRPISDRWSTLALAIAVPGLTWLPLHRLAVDGGAIPQEAIEPLDVDLAPLRSIGLWAVLLGLSLAPTVVAATTGGRSWSAGGSGGHPALGSLASRASSGPVWRVGFPAITFGTSLALAEVTASTGGLIDRFMAAVDQGRPDDLMALAAPVIVAGALLVPAADLGASILRRVERPNAPGTDRVRPGRGQALAAAGLVTVVAAVAIAGLVAGSDTGAGTDPVGSPFAGPSFGGPWLGTDESGRSVAAVTAEALATTLAGSALPALAATAVGAGLAFFRRTQRPASRSAIDVLLDLVSWPAMLVVPLAAWPVAGTERSLLHPVVLQIIGLSLVPMATRLQVRSVRGAERAARLLAAAGTLAAVALAVQLLTGFVVPLGEDHRPGLGHLAASGFDGAGSSPWPLTSALVAAASAATALLWSVGALSRVGRTMATTTESDGWSEARPDGALLGAEPGEGDTEPIEPVPPRVILVDDIQTAGADQLGSPVSWSPVLAGRDHVEDAGATVQGDATLVEVEVEVEAGVEVEDDIERVDDPIDIREDITIGSVVDVPPPDGQAQDGTTIEDEASQTVELRPADLRRAGVQPEPDGATGDQPRRKSR